MRSFAGRLENFGPLEDAAFLFRNIADEADVKVTYKRFSLVTSSRHTPFRFVAELHILPHFFAHYSIGIHRNINSSISLPLFHTFIRNARNYYSQLTILMEPQVMALKFRNFSSWWRHELVLLHPVEEELGPIDFENFFTIHSNDFRRIIREVSQFPNTSVCVTITNSQVKFSVAFREIILSKQAGQCGIVGYEGDVETQFRITLHPTLFFLTLSHHTQVVWFHKTINNFGIIYIPTLESYVEYVIHFPYM